MEKENSNETAKKKLISTFRYPFKKVSANKKLMAFFISIIVWERNKIKIGKRK
jgi:hypothetical protein